MKSLTISEGRLLVAEMKAIWPGFQVITQNDVTAKTFQNMFQSENFELVRSCIRAIGKIEHFPASFAQINKMVCNIQGAKAGKMARTAEDSFDRLKKLARRDGFEKGKKLLDWKVEHEPHNPTAITGARFWERFCFEDKVSEGFLLRDFKAAYQSQDKTSYEQSVTNLEAKKLLTAIEARQDENENLAAGSRDQRFITNEEIIF